jgi:glycerol dehydrogenase-like iron-containing ADH family enzyme
MMTKPISHNNGNQSIIVVSEKAGKILDKLTRDDLFVYSENSLLNLHYGKEIVAQKICVSHSGINKKWIDEFAKKNDFDRVISLGNGKVTDVAKYIAHNKKVHLTAIPPILSNNVYFTDKVCLSENNSKVTCQAKTPEVLIYDEDFLLQSDFQFHLYGLMDIACMYVSLMDWKLANIINNEEIDEDIYLDCEKLLDELTSKREIIFKKDKRSLKIIFDLLKETGNIVCKHGSGRPVSGSEHIFSKSIEQEIKVYHGESVALGILLLSSFSRSNETTNFLFEYIEELGILKRIKENVPREVVLKIFKNIKPKENRFTILDIVCPINTGRAKSIVSKIYD